MAQPRIARKSGTLLSDFAKSAMESSVGQYICDTSSEGDTVGPQSSQGNFHNDNERRTSASSQASEAESTNRTAKRTLGRKRESDENSTDRSPPRRSLRERVPPETYAVNARSFPKYAEPSPPRSQSGRMKSQRTLHGTRTSSSHSRSVNKYSRNSSKSRTKGVKDEGFTPPPRQSKRPNTQTLPNVEFSCFLRNDLGARFRAIDACPTVGSLFDFVHKTAQLEGQVEYSKAVICHLSWAPEALDILVMQDDEDDFNGLLRKIQAAPPGEWSTVEVSMA